MIVSCPSVPTATLTGTAPGPPLELEHIRHTQCLCRVRCMALDLSSRVLPSDCAAAIHISAELSNKVAGF
jgi:hypothetical protein